MRQRCCLGRGGEMREAGSRVVSLLPMNGGFGKGEGCHQVPAV